ncbi:MAG: hypothetical protein ACJ79A_05960 [Gemmatimonadaceae bacterium]
MTLHELVERERRHVRRREVIAGLLLGAGATALIIAVGAGVLGGARWLALPRITPFFVWLLVAGAAAALAWRTRERLRRGATRSQVAHAIESEQRLRRGALLGALELEGRGALAARAATAARGTLPRDGALAPALRKEGHQRAAFAAGGALVAALVLASASPLFGDGLRAVLQPVDAWRGALLARPVIDSAPAYLLRGAPVRLTIRAPGRQRVMLAVRQTGEAWRTDTLDVDAHSGVARWTLDALRGDLRLVASDGRASSDSVVIHAADRPFLGAVVLRATYPAYLGRPAENLAAGEPMRLPRGTSVAISGRASVPLASVTLADETGGTVALTPSGHAFAGRLVAEKSARLRWLASGAGGPVADVPAPLELEVLVDSAPRVEITAPTGDTLLAATDRVGLGLTASDDHGIATLALRIARLGAGGDGPGIGQSIVSAVGTSWVGVASVDVAALQLQPGDAVRVRAEAVDASPWGQRGVSRDLIIKRPTLEESRTEARVLGDSAAKEARAAATAQKSLAQRTDEASRAQTRDGGAQGSQSSAQRSNAAEDAQKSMNYESAERARSLAQEQRAMSERVERLRQATQQLEQQLKAAGALDSSLARQLSEAQALLRQALTPELMAQMQKLENAAKEMNGEQSRDALRDLAQMQQRLKDQLARSAEMLKRAAHEGAMQTLSDEARELAQKQKALADSPRGGSPKDDRSAGQTSKDAKSQDAKSQDAKSQDAKGQDAKGQRAKEASNLAERAQRLRDAMQELKERLAKDDAAAGAAKTGEAKEHAQKSETGMRKASNAMQTGQEAQAQRGGDKAGENGESDARDAAAEMQQAAQSMQDAREAQVNDWKKELTSELDQSVQDMMQLARQESALEQQARSGAQGDDRRAAQSAVEQGVTKASERLQSAGRKSALLSPRSSRAVNEAQAKVSQATQSVGGSSGQPSQQAGALKEAADALTKAAASLARDRERANSAKSASGFSEMIQQMQEMAQKQGQLNAQAQGMMSMPNGSGAGPGQSIARQLARQQRSIADQLDEVGDAAGGDRAAQLAREARQLAEALDNGRLDAGTLARQQQLFRRLLDAGRSLEKEERDDSGKREATSAKGGEAFTPTDKVDAKAAIKFRPPTWQEMRELSPDERRAILDYFTRINSAPAP